MKAAELTRYMNHFVTLRLDERRAGQLKLDDPVLNGKVTNVSSEGIVFSVKSTTHILLAQDILDIRVKRGRVVTRMVREFTERDDVRQHLADRHGTSMVMLRSLSPEVALAYHAKIDHSDLGHRHGPKPGTRAVDADGASRAMEQLDEMELDE